MRLALVAAMSALAETPRRRPPAIVMVDESGSDAADAAAWARGLDDAAGAGSARGLAARRGALRVVTWNVWFSERRQGERRALLLRELAREDPDVVGLQEVTDDVAARLRRHAGLVGRYAVSPNEVQGYGAVLLVRRALAPAFSELPLATKMGRTCVFAELSALAPRRVAVATVHLESLDEERRRRAQLRAIAAALAPFDSAALFGDFNFDDRATWGDWRPGRRKRPRKAALENEVLAEELPDYVDAWPRLFPGDRGLTFDGARNANVRDPGERMRYDRVVVRAARLADASLLGTRPDGDGLFVSDHFGLRVDMDINAGGEPEERAPAAAA